MKLLFPLTLFAAFAFNLLPAQSPSPFNKLSFLFGEWQGEGQGFGNTSSVVKTSFTPVMNGRYIEVKNDARFAPTEKNPQGEHHLDQGMISYDKARDALIYREFNIEGFVNRYVLIDSLSNDSLFVFETEAIENFVPGGKARWTLRRTGAESFETAFDLSFPGKPYSCYGTHQMRRIK